MDDKDFSLCPCAIININLLRVDIKSLRAYMLQLCLLAFS